MNGIGTMWRGLLEPWRESGEPGQLEDRGPYHPELLPDRAGCFRVGWQNTSPRGLHVADATLRGGYRQLDRAEANAVLSAAILGHRG